MKRKRVLFLIPDLAHGGAERVLVNLVNHLDQKVFDVTLQTLFDVGINRQFLSESVHYKPGFTWQFRGNSKIIKLLPPQFLYSTIVKEQYDIVVSYLEGSTTRILSGCPFPNTKKVCWIHIELDSEKKYRLCFSSSKEATNAYLMYDRIICVSKTVQQAFEQSAGRSFRQIEVLYNTNETDKIRKLALEPVEDVVFDRDIVNVCSVAKIVPTKGYDRLVRVHKRLIDEGYRHHIYVLGTGEQKEELEFFLKENSLEDSFTFLGFRENPYKYIAACDIYLCSSRREGFSTAVTESLVIGTPVVSTCCSGAYELLGEPNTDQCIPSQGTAHELCEFGIVTENSEQGIYEGFKRMLADAELRRYYAQQANVRGQRFSTEKTVKAVEDMLLSL